MTTITPTERAELRKILLAAGQRPSGLTDEQLIQQAGAIQQAPTTAPIEPTPTPATTTPEPTPMPMPTTTTTPDTSAITTQVAALLAQLAAAQPTQQVDEAQVIALIEKHATAPRQIDVKIERYTATTPTTIENAHPALAETLDIIDCYPITGVAPYLVGGAGSGKTTLGIQVAQALDLPFYSTGAVMDKFELLGFVDANGTYQESALYKAFKHGGVFLFDEIDASDAGALVAFNQALANGKYTFPDGNTTEKHPDFKAIAAANTIGTGATRRYVGRCPLDGATLDRFHQINVEYSHTIEHRMAHAAANTINEEYDRATIDKWIDTVTTTRAKLETIAPDVITSPRATQRGAALLAKGWQFDRVTESVLHAHLTQDQVQRLGA